MGKNLNRAEVIFASCCPRPNGKTCLRSTAGSRLASCDSDVRGHSSRGKTARRSLGVHFCVSKAGTVSPSVISYPLHSLFWMSFDAPPSGPYAQNHLNVRLYQPQLICILQEMKFQVAPELLNSYKADMRTQSDDDDDGVIRTTVPLCAETFPKVLSAIDTFIFDADGVLWLGEGVIPGSPRLIDFLIRHRKQVIVLTNNATKSRALYAKKLSKLGYNNKLNKETLVNPAAVVADTLHRANLKGKKVYMIGSQGMRDEMDELNIEYFGHGPEPQDHSDGSAFMYDIELKEKPSDVGAVVVGYEKHFNYHKLMKASNYLRNPDCLFVATNEDETCPGPNPEVIIPDAGPLVAAVRCASGRDPLTVGKPNSPAFDYICRKWRIDPKRTMMVGDRTNTDVKFGRDHGLKTLLVLSGCHQIDDILENQMNDRDDMIPDYYAPCLGALLPSRAQHV
ncbi:unnamed protein product [Caenorhabditis auriculariae]|uniref:Uncharacterized protein n=1 Tax=Caenorhabditis auriculariae TaxID=2777116 RepID=A0A8S1HBW7_9PELO|nr:unnamed protein product [Caenorhabditis auriculariae]